MTSQHIIGAWNEWIFRQFVEEIIGRKMASKSKGRMCAVAGCNNRPSDTVSVHVFPKDERQRAACSGGYSAGAPGARPPV